MSSQRYTPDQEQLVSLIGRCSIKDQAAFKALYDETSPAILGLLIRMLPNREAAEDCLQEAFLQFWNNANQYHVGKGPVFSWMITIARYRAIDRIRKQRYDVELSDAESVLVDTADLAPVAGTEEKRLQACLAELEPNTASLIVKSYVEGYTQQELSQQTDTPLGTVKSWLRRGLAALKSCMATSEANL